MLGVQRRIGCAVGRSDRLVAFVPRRKLQIGVDPWCAWGECFVAEGVGGSWEESLQVACSVNV